MNLTLVLDLENFWSMKKLLTRNISIYSKSKYYKYFLQELPMLHLSIQFQIDTNYPNTNWCLLNFCLKYRLKGICRQPRVFLLSVFAWPLQLTCKFIYNINNGILGELWVAISILTSKSSIGDDNHENWAMDNQSIYIHSATSFIGNDS